MSPKALSPKDAVTLYPALGPLGSLANMRAKIKGRAPRGPRFFKVGRKVVYRPEDIEAYLFSAPILTSDSVESAR